MKKKEELGLSDFFVSVFPDPLRIRTYNLDGNDFIQISLKELNANLHPKEDELSFFDHYIMNLPALAPEFLSILQTLFDFELIDKFF